MRSTVRLTSYLVSSIFASMLALTPSSMFVSSPERAFASEGSSLTSAQTNPPINWPDGLSYKAPLNPFAASGFGGQCTSFAWGRAHEVTGTTALPKGNGKTWYSAVHPFEKGREPRMNSIAVWKGDTVNPHGHVAFIESVSGDTVSFTEANVETFKDTNFGGGYDGYIKRRTKTQMLNRGRGVGELIGYIYLGSASGSPRPVVSTGLKLSPGTSGYQLGQRINGTFSITNRGTGNLFMKRVVIGGRLAGTCPNEKCPDFGPVPGNITLAPGEIYNYAGTFTPSLAGNYDFYVAYENSDGKWTVPVEAENNNVNRLNITVQSLIPRVVVSRSLTITPAGPYPIGQTVRGSFSITNRGNTNVVMRQVLIGGRLANTCPNDVCPDFSPINPNITLGPGQTFNYSGQIPLTRTGTYTFYVAYQTPDGRWEMPVRPENGTINRLSLLVQPPSPTLTGANPTAIGASATAQSITLSGTRLAKVIYAELRLPNGSITYLYIPLNQLFRVNDDQTRIRAKFLSRGTYYVTVWTAEGRSNRYPIVVN